MENLIYFIFGVFIIFQVYWNGRRLRKEIERISEDRLRDLEWWKNYAKHTTNEDSFSFICENPDCKHCDYEDFAQAEGEYMVWDEIVKSHNPYFELEDGEDTERLDDFITFLKLNYHPPKPKPFLS